MAKSNYKLKLVVLTKVWESEGRTFEEAVENLGISWEQIKGKGILTIKKGNKRHEHLMTMPLLRRMFNNKVARAIWARRFDYLLQVDSKTNVPDKLTIEEGEEE